MVKFSVVSEKKYMNIIKLYILSLLYTWLNNFQWNSPKNKKKKSLLYNFILHIDGLVQECGSSIAIALELPQPYTKPQI